ncbi:ABC transporter substrate-binding protein [Brevibacillus sp. SYP-B805]|uniref:ABC transporter substrate-binding protein n=1 Tax=Brevibacillus sp. SYP-B805 TaxID=1578199 RepID=UPI0013EA7EF4|nr:ABC transporter substrate-binding protein [Brevibacillus sp. SYP-B805]NGQ96234.1 ABC transporter substrate-binding protein [Brevibacillus sp. SYP-B805]
MSWNGKRITLSLFSLLLAGSLTACSTPVTPANQQTEPSKPSEPQELTIALDWYPNAVHSFLYAAEEQGYFKEENLKVTLQMPADANDPLKLAAAGKVDAAISYQPQIVQARAEGLPVVSIAALVRHPLNVIMARKDSGIHSPKDLAGKHIGYPAVPLDESMVRTMIKTNGGDDSGVAFTDIGFDIVPALTGKKVDAVVGGYINHEKLLLEKNGIAVEAFDPRQYGVPDYYELVLATSDDTLAKKKEALAAFMRAAAKGQEYVAKNKEKALDLLLAKQATEFPLDADVEKKSLDILLPLMDAGSEPFGSQSAASWQTLIDWMTKEKLITTEVKVESVMKNVP